MNEKLVSIVIPVYKTENYLESCIESALAQRYPATEIILVDDGSPDRCPQICDDYGAKYNNVTVIHQKNAGLGFARNAGAKAARGEYVCWLDSDDLLDGPDAVSVLVEEAERSGADIVVGNFRKFFENQIRDVNRHHLRAGEYAETADFRFKGFYRYGHLAYDWGKLYRREFLVKNKLWCRDYPFTQDKAHNILCHAYKPVYAFVEDSVYLYRLNDESITFRYKPDLIPVWISIARDFHQELKDRGVEDVYDDVTAFHLFFGSFFVAKQEFLAGHGFREAKAQLKRYGEDAYVRQNMKALAHGKYLKGISGFYWRVMIRTAAILFSLRWYFLFTLGIVILRGFHVDGMITAKRNGRAGRGKKGGCLKSDVRMPKTTEALCMLLRKSLTGKNLSDGDLEELKNAGISEVLSLADRHKILPMLFDSLEEWDELETEDRRLLENAAERTAKQSYRLLFLTKELTELFQEANLRVVVLKGSGVASYYPMPESRKSGDVDLLFPDMESVLAAGKLLEGKGYHLTEEQHANHHLVYQGPDGIDVELHAMLAEPFDDEEINRRMEALLPKYLEERTVTNSMGVELPTTSEALQALELLLHMLQHFLRAGFGLKLLADWVVFWNRVADEKVAARFVSLAQECKVSGFAKAVTLVCEKYLGLDRIHIYGPDLEKEFSKDYTERFLTDVVDAEEFGKADKNRMVALRNRGFWGYVKEFHYQMRMNNAEESKKKWKWPYLWAKTFVTFLRNNRRLGRGSLHDILKNAGERAGVVEEMQLFKKRK